MPEIHTDMTLHEILEIKPNAKELLFEYGVLSENLNVESMETVREACSAQEMDEDKVEELMEKLEAL